MSFRSSDTGNDVPGCRNLGEGKLKTIFLLSHDPSIPILQGLRWIDFWFTCTGKNAIYGSYACEWKTDVHGFDRLYAFETGETIPGNAGGGTCLETVVIPFLENRPVFTCGDHGGRMHMRLNDEEILVCIPYTLVPGLVTNLDKTVYAKE